MNTNLGPDNSDHASQASQSTLSNEDKNNHMITHIKNFRLSSRIDDIESLLNNGVSANLTTSEGKSLLMIAAEKGCIELVQLLLECNADVRYRDRKHKTALFYAVETAHENLDVVSLILAHQGDPNAEMHDGKTPLLRAIEKGSLEITKILLEKGGNSHYTVESTGDSALHLAVRTGNAHLVRLLLKQKCDPNVKNKNKETPLDLCQNNKDLAEILQNVNKGKLPEPQQFSTQSTQNAIDEFLKIQAQRMAAIEPTNEPDNEANQDAKEPQQSETQDETKEQKQSTSEETDSAKIQQKQPQDYRRHQQQQQQQQLQQKKSPQHYQKPEKEPPARKYPGKNDTFALKRTVSNSESVQADNLLNDSASKSTSNANTVNNTPIAANSTNTTPIPNSSEPQSSKSLNQESTSNSFSQALRDESSERSNMSPFPAKNNEHSKYHENIGSSSALPHQHKSAQNKRNNPNISDMTATHTVSDKFRERDHGPPLIKAVSSDYPQQYTQQQQHHYQQQQQQQLHPPQQQQQQPHPPQQQQQNTQPGPFINNASIINQMGLSPAQGKNSASPGFHNNTQFFNASAVSPNNGNQPFQKKKPKGQQVNTNIPGNKNFPPNNFPAPIPNQYNKGANDVRVDPRTPNIQTTNVNVGGKPNRNQDRNFQQDAAMPQRGFVGSPVYQHPNAGTPNVIDGPEPQRLASEGSLAKGPANVRNPEDSIKDPKGVRPQPPPQQHQQQHQHQHQQQQQQHQQQLHPQQQQQPPNNMVFNNGNQNMMFQPLQFMDPRMMVNNMPNQNPMLFNPPFPQPQGGNINMVGNVAQGNFMQGGFSPNPHPPRNQQGLNQMMQPTFGFQNGMQVNPSMPGDPKKIYFNMVDPLQKENLRIQADIPSMLRGLNTQMAELEKTKQDNKGLKLALDDIQQSEQSMLKQISEKEKMIEELTKKNEDLELAVKTASAKTPFINRQDTASSTTGLLESFQCASLDGVLEDPKQNIEFWKQENLANALHEEILGFERSVDNFNAEKKTLFESLISLFIQAAEEVVPNVEYYIYGSFATGLSLPWSDIDIVIKVPQSYYNMAFFDTIESTLRKRKWVEDIKVIKKTSVPVLKVTCTKMYWSKKVDISIQDSRHNGLGCVDLVRDYSSLYPAVRPLVLILKQFLYRLNLNDTYSGGLSSYALILMVVYMLQTRELHTVNPNDNKNLGTLLLSFLYLYGFDFDYINQFIVNPKKPPKPNELPTDPYLENMNLMNILNQGPPSVMEPKIIIQDPLSSINNVGRSTFQIKQIKNAFMAAYFEAYKPCICEIHKFVTELDSEEGRKPIHKCASIFRRMILAYHPNK